MILQIMFLGHFSKAEQELMSEGYDNAVKAVELIVSDQMSEAMNEYNRKKRTSRDASFFRTIKRTG